MMEDAERLSQLLDGELSAAEAQELHRRIAREPALAALWASMQSLPEALAALPTLPEGVARPRPARRWSAGWGVALALAASAAFVLGRWSVPVSTVTLLDAELALRGHVALDVDEHSVEDPMVRSFLAGGLTVGLISGAAWLTTGDGATAELRPGETVAVAPRSESTVRAARPLPIAPDQDAAEQQEQLQRNVDRLAFENALLKGALRRHEGEPHPFPEDYPAELRPEGFDASILELLQAHPELELSGSDCSEYPCVAWIEGMGETDRAWQDTLDDLKQGFETREGWGNHWVWSFPYVQKENDRSRAMVGMMVHPGPVPEDVTTRIKHRVELAMEERIGVWRQEQLTP
ncbi:MAG: hypothetical protein KTR31_31960 [Myxococcales bacterium]|nr:hypothetical protein [Myxococcales bacterium]